MASRRYILTLSACIALVLSINTNARVEGRSSNSRTKEKLRITSWILFVAGVKISAVPEGLVEKCCDVAESTVSGIKCHDSWKAGAVIEGELKREKRVRILNRMNAVKAMPRGAEMHLEENLHVATGALQRQRNVPHNLGRLVGPKNKRQTTYRYSATGKGVNVYIFDTAVNMQHTEFRDRQNKNQTRVSLGYSTVKPGNGGKCGGHGTHVAGVVGGVRCGVAKDVNLISMEVVPCDGPGNTGHVLMGLEWLLENFKAPAVVQMSLVALGRSRALNAMVQEVIDAGITFVLSSGNYGSDARDFSPAMVSDVIVVGNIDSNDVLEPRSNYGPAVDIFAPGVSIMGPVATKNKGFKYLTGTSQAAPHVTGVVAQYLESNPKAKPSDVSAHLIRNSAKDQILDCKGGPNRIIQTDLSEDKIMLTQSLGWPVAQIRATKMDSVILYNSSGNHSATRTIRVKNAGLGILTIRITVDNSHSNKWFKVSRRMITLMQMEEVEIVVGFNARSLKEGRFRGRVDIETNDASNRVTRIPVGIYVYCRRLLSRADADTPAAMFTNPSLRYETDKTVVATANLFFRQPISRIPVVTNRDIGIPFGLSVEGGGVVEVIDGNNNWCSSFTIAAKFSVKTSELSNSQTQFCLTIKENEIVDAFGNFFPETRLCLPSTIRERTVKLFGPGMIYTTELGAITEETTASIVAVFSEDTAALQKHSIDVEPFGPVKIQSIVGLKPENRVFRIELEIDPGYYGHVSLTIMDHVFNSDDLTQGSLHEEKKISFTRTSNTRISHKGFSIVK